MKRPFYKRLFYFALKYILRLSFSVLFHVRVFGAENYPGQGGALICANHQSNLDPPLVGMSCPRRINYLAKKSLFKFPLGVIIRLLDAIPIERGGMGIGGIKETLRRIKRNEIVLIFPEGARTFDGEMLKLKPGFVTIAKRTKVPLVPVGISGAFEVWPRGTLFPRLGVVYLVVHKPVQPEEFLEREESEVVNLMTERMTSCFNEARQRRLDTF